MTGCIYLCLLCSVVLRKILKVVKRKPQNLKGSQMENKTQKQKRLRREPKSKRFPGKIGRPNIDEALSLEDYKLALERSGGRFIEAAKVLGVTVNAVFKWTKKHPVLQEIRNNRKRERIETALSVVDSMLSPKNKDKSTKLRASLFVLNTESEEHAEKTETQISGDVSVNLPAINVNFVKPKKEK